MRAPALKKLPLRRLALQRLDGGHGRGTQPATNPPRTAQPKRLAANARRSFDLGITERTTKIHRHQVLAKMEADSVADLVRLAGDLGIVPAGAVK